MLEIQVPNSDISLIEKYFFHIQKEFADRLDHKPESKLALFCNFLKYIPLKLLKNEPKFRDLSEFIKQNYRDENFLLTKIAIFLVRIDKLDALRYLIDGCGYRLQHTIDAESKRTLLHEACLFNKPEIVSYLLEKGANPNTKDTSGMAPLHLAVINAQPEKLLVEFKKHQKTNFKIKDIYGATLLHYAAMKGHNHLFNILIRDYKVDRHAKMKNGRLYINIDPKNTTLNIPFPTTKENIEVKLETKYFLNLMYENLKPQSFVKLKKEFETHHYKEIQALINTWICSREAFNVTQLNEYIDSLKQNFLFGFLDLVPYLLSILDFLLKNQEFISAKILSDYICELLPKNDFSQKILAALEQLTIAYNTIGCFNEVEKFADQLHAALDQSENLKLKAEVYYNLALNANSQNNNNRALAYLARAFEYSPEDEDIFYLYLIILLESNNYSDAKSICLQNSSLLSGQYCLQYINCLLGMADWQILLTDTFQEFQTSYTFYQIHIHALLSLGLFEKAFSTMEILFPQIEKDFKEKNICFPQAISTYLECFVASNQIKKGLDFFEKYFLEYQAVCNIYPKLIQRAICLYLSIGESEKALELTKLIEKDAYYHNFIVDCYIIAFCNTVEIEAEQNPKSYFEKVKSYELSEDRLELIEHLIRVLEAFKQNVSDDKIIVDDVNYDPKKTHAFYQEKKKALLAPMDKQTNPFPGKVATGWLVRNQLYRNSELGLIELSSIYFPNYFATIDESLNLDQMEKTQFTSALRKGFCTRKQHENGIKFLKPSLFELKIDDDLRLYTTKVYQNTDGMRLIIFDQIGNHSKIAQLLQIQSPLEVIQVQNTLSKTSISDKPSTMFSSGKITEKKSQVTDLVLAKEDSTVDYPNSYSNFN